MGLPVSVCVFECGRKGVPALDRGRTQTRLGSPPARPLRDFLAPLAGWLVATARGPPHPTLSPQALGKRFYVDPAHFEDKELLARLVPAVAAEEASAAAKEEIEKVNAEQ